MHSPRIQTTIDDLFNAGQKEIGRIRILALVLCQKSAQPLYFHVPRKLAYIVNAKICSEERCMSL